MSKPVWVTPAGNLGTIPEGVFYSIPLLAVNPSNTDTIYYQLIAGNLPHGIQINETGILTGIPKAMASIQGVPTTVYRDVTSKFAVRDYTQQTQGSITVITHLTDRTFEITVTGQNGPAFTTPSGQIAQYFDGGLVTGLQVEYSTPDPNNPSVVRLVAGSLPSGLTIGINGVISGFIAPNAQQNQTAGYSRDGQGYDQYPFDFTTHSNSINYEFVLEVTDGKTSDLRTFSIFVWSRNDLTADDTFIPADNTFITADGSPVRVPIILNPQGSIGTVQSDNFFAYEFNGLDLDGDQFRYVGTNLPPGLQLDPESGWLYGYIPNLGLTEYVYDFAVVVHKLYNADIASTPYDYSLSINGVINGNVTWTTPNNLGTIINGSVSTLYVEAQNVDNLVLQYQLVSGSNSLLPQGLELLPNGEIAGRVSFNTFALDSGTTTFDVSRTNGADPTTIDMTYKFTVNAYSSNGIVNVTNTFSITVARLYNQPYENLYIQAMPPRQDRDLINSLLQNSDIFQPSLLYRPQDPNFGVASHVIYQHAYGLTASTIDAYYSALYENHYWKSLTLGKIKTAQALDNNGNILYEVIYSEVVDNLVNNHNQSVGKEVTLPYAIENNSVDVVYPNSLVNMRTQVIDTVGQLSNILPRWMLSKQANGSALGFTPAWVIAYTKPGQANRIAYYISTEFGTKLNLIDFKADRYEVDRSLTKNWNAATNKWTPTPPTTTTFDIDCHYQITNLTNGSGYHVDDVIKISGTQVGGITPLNDITIQIKQISDTGAILGYFVTSGVAPINSATTTWTGIAGTNLIGTGSGAVWNFVSVPGTVTAFDYNSLQFTAPVDMYSDTTGYDKYLVFPKRNILG